MESFCNSIFSVCTKQNILKSNGRYQKMLSMKFGKAPAIILFYFFFVKVVKFTIV